MAVETLRPNATTSHNWPSLSGATAHQATSDDSDTTYIRNNTNVSQEDILELGSTSLTTETIDSINVRFRARSETSATGVIQCGVQLSGNETLGSERTSVPTSATNYEDTALGRPGGGSWSVSDLNSLQVVAYGRKGTSGGIRCFELFVDVNYSAGASVTMKDIISVGLVFPR